jgi:Domain of unknown function (DUF4388)
MNAIIEGTFDRTSMDDLLQVVSLSRQCLEVVLGTAGTMTVKGGQVLAARANPSEVGAAAFCALYASPGQRYSVVRREAPLGDAAPIGSITSLVDRARRAPRIAAPSEPVVVIEGRLSETPLPELLDVVSLSRNTFRVELPEARGHLVVRGGQLLAIEVAGEPDPMRALGRLLRAESGTFTVLRTPAVRGVRPLGALADLLVEAEGAWEDFATVVEFPSGALHTVLATAVVDDAVARLEGRVDGLEAKLAEAPPVAGDVIATLAALEERVRAFDLRLATGTRGVRADRALAVVSILVQIAIAASVIGATVWMRTWTP